MSEPGPVIAEPRVAVPAPRDRSLQLPTLACFVVSLIFTFALSIDAPFNVDENVFITSGALVARVGLMPYRDFHYNHMPTLVLIYAGLFHLTDHLLLIARAFSAICAAGAVTAIFHLGARLFEHFGPRRRFVYAAAIVVLYMSNPLFTGTVGRAWNHDFPALTCVLAFLLIREALNQNRAGWRVFAAGLLVTLALTTRLTFTPVACGLGLLLLIDPRARTIGRARLVGTFVAGAIVVMLPSAWVWAHAPANAFFGNFLYPRLNTRYHFDTGSDSPFSLPGRIWHLATSTFGMPAQGVLVILFATLMAVTLKARQVLRSSEHCELGIVVVLVLLLAAAAFAPSPMHRQYCFGLVPFLAIGVTLCASHFPRLPARVERWMCGTIAICVLLGIFKYDGVLRLANPQAWVPVQIHNRGVQLASDLGTSPKPVLTLAPIYPLEGNLEIYPELSTGRFGLRVGKYLTESQQAAYLMPDTQDIEAWFKTRPPAGVLLVGTDMTLESSLEAFAEESGLVEIRTDDQWRCFAPPKLTAVESMRHDLADRKDRQQ